MKKTISSEEKLTKLNAPQIPEKRDDKEDVKAINGNFHQRAKVHRRVKLPRLKLEDLVFQITEETHIEKSPRNMQLEMEFESYHWCNQKKSEEE